MKKELVFKRLDTDCYDISATVKTEIDEMMLSEFEATNGQLKQPIKIVIEIAALTGNLPTEKKKNGI